MKHEEFTERAARRLESYAARFEDESRRLGIGRGKIENRAGELRLAARLIRDEARVVSESEAKSIRVRCKNPDAGS